MNVVFRSVLLDCEIDSSMSPLFIEQLSNMVFKKLISSLNKQFKLNSIDFDEMLTYLDGDDYALVARYKDVYNFLFKSQYYSKVNMETFSNILRKANSYGIEISIDKE